MLPKRLELEHLELEHLGWQPPKAAQQWSSSPPKLTFSSFFETHEKAQYAACNRKKLLPKRLELEHLELEHLGWQPPKAAQQWSSSPPKLTFSSFF